MTHNVTSATTLTVGSGFSPSLKPDNPRVGVVGVGEGAILASLLKRPEEERIVRVPSAIHGYVAREVAWQGPSDVGQILWHLEVYSKNISLWG